MKILRIAMDGEEHPHYTITRAFESSFDYVKTIWWQQVGDFNKLIIHEVKNIKYDAVFIQIQADNVISEEAARAIYEHSLGVNWTGDVRTDINWYIKMGKYFVTLFTNMTDVMKMRNEGLRAEYLQVGYDNKYYFPAERECHQNIVFCANYYPSNDYPLTGLRKDLIIALKHEFADKFNLYGGGWKSIGLNAEYDRVNNEQEAEIYRTCAIAINCSHFDYSRYSSDRLFRELASGAFVLSHRYEDYEMDFKEGKHFVTWENIPDLIKKCHYYLGNAHERNDIGRNAAGYVSRTANWRERVAEFKELIYKYKK